MSYVLQEVPQSLSAFFDDDNPLGPVAAEHINDTEVAAYLTSLQNDAFREMSQGVSLLFGRKGAGKSSLLHSFLFPNQLKSVTALSFEQDQKIQFLGKDSDFRRPYDVTVQVDASKELDAVHAQVCKHTLPGPELAADHWKKRLWINVLIATSRRPDLIARLDEPLKSQMLTFSTLTRRLASTESATSYMDDWLDTGAVKIESVEMLAKDLKQAFIKNEFTVLFLIDSIEEYNLSLDEALKITIGGLLYVVGGRRDPLCYYKIAFPYEIYDDIKSQGNTGKINLQSATLNWRPAELVQIVTRRILLCLYLYENATVPGLLTAARSASSSRRANFAFWEEVFGGDIINEAHNPETALYYVLRHTQLLPRQVILALSWLIRLSKNPRTSFRFVSPDVITDATRQSSNILIGGIESGFRFTYPDLQQSLERFLPRCNIVSNYSDLHHIYSTSSVKGTAEYTRNFYAFMRALLHIGVFGVVDRKQETDRYIEAKYCYGDGTVLRAFEGKEFAMHPAFSLLYKEQDERLDVGKAILPRGSVEGLA